MLVKYVFEIFFSIFNLCDNDSDCIYKNMDKFTASEYFADSMGNQMKKMKEEKLFNDTVDHVNRLFYSMFCLASNKSCLNSFIFFF